MLSNLFTSRKDAAHTGAEVSPSHSLTPWQGGDSHPGLPVPGPVHSFLSWKALGGGRRTSLVLQVSLPRSKSSLLQRLLFLQGALTPR